MKLPEYITDKPLSMCPVLYKQRRRVMGAIYEANKLLTSKGFPKLPRIEIRICEMDKHGAVKGQTALGCSYTGGPFVTISKNMEHWSNIMLTHIVWHEIAHNVFDAEHDDKCPLMKPCHSPQPKTKLVKAFLKLAGSYRI